MLVSEKPSTSTVIVVGPSVTEFGGMASVVRQMLALDFGDEYRPEAFPVTVSSNPGESPIARLTRHVRHLSLLRAAVLKAQAPIVHIHTCSGFSFFRSVLDMLVAQRLGRPAILHIHGAAFDEFYDDAGPLSRRLIAWSLSRADRVVALSESWRAKLHEMAPDARLTVIENAVAIPPAPPSDGHKGPCRFVLLARMDEWKGIDDLLAACVDLRTTGVDLEVVLAGPPGTAGHEDTLAQKIGTRGLEHVIRYVGPVQGEEKAGLLHWADAYVQPSHHEGMPISLLEALAHGLPVVATRVGAVPEVISDGREGLLVPPHQPSALAAAMRDLAGDAARRRAMSCAARLKASSRFSLDRFRDDLVSLYDAVRTGNRVSPSCDDALVAGLCPREMPSADPIMGG